MWENAAQMQIVSLNLWQYAGRVRIHANSAQPPNSHLAPKLKISLHFGGTWYCLSDPYTSSVCARLATRRALTRRGMLSTRIRTPPGRTAAYAWRTALFSSATVEGGSSISRIQRDIWSQTCSIGFMSGLQADQSMTSTSCWSKKAAVSRVVWGGALSWTYTKLRPNTPIAHGNIWFLRICMYRSRFMAPSTTTSSLLPTRWIAPHTMTDGPRLPLLGWTQALVSLSPCLRRTRTRPSLWYRVNRDSSLKIQCLHCLRSHSMCLLSHSRQRRLCSKVSLGHLAGRRDQYPAARSRLPMVRTDIRLPNRRIICIRRRGGEMRWSGSFWPFGAVDGLPVVWRFSSNPHASSDVVGKFPGCVAKFCLCILETPPASWLLLSENCHLLTTWQFAAVFAVANFVAWPPLKVQRNINNHYRNPTLHKSIKMVMVRQTSLQVTTPVLAFCLLLSLSGPQTILTVFGHSIWLRNGSIKSTVFRSEIVHTTRNNKYRSNSRKCHLLVVIP